MIQRIRSDSNIDLKIITASDDQFCPLYLDIFPDNGISLHYSMQNQWYYSETNDIVHKPTVNKDYDGCH